jgi:hypothetical protein
MGGKHMKLARQQDGGGVVARMAHLVFLLDVLFKRGDLLVGDAGRQLGENFALDRISGLEHLLGFFGCRAGNEGAAVLRTIVRLTENSSPIDSSLNFMPGINSRARIARNKA